MKNQIQNKAERKSDKKKEVRAIAEFRASHPLITDLSYCRLM